MTPANPPAVCPDPYCSQGYVPGQPNGEPVPCPRCHPPAVCPECGKGDRVTVDIGMSGDFWCARCGGGFMAPTPTDEGRGTPVHNHGTADGPGLACRERIVDGRLRGACMDAAPQKGGGEPWYASVVDPAEVRYVEWLEAMLGAVVRGEASLTVGDGGRLAGFMRAALADKARLVEARTALAESQRREEDARAREKMADDQVERTRQAWEAERAEQQATVARLTGEVEAVNGWATKFAAQAVEACDIARRLTGELEEARTLAEDRGIFCEQQAARADAAEATLTALREKALECASDLEAEVRARYGYPDIHPAQQQKYERDMEPVEEVRRLATLTPSETGSPE